MYSLFITLIRDTIIFTTTDILSTINTHNTELQMVKVHTKHSTIVSSSSCHQTCVFHLSTHFFAVSLKLLMSSNEQGRARRVHCIMCAVVYVAILHSHVASPSKYPNFCLCSLLHVNHVRSRFRHIHVVHGLSYPLARLSLRLTVTLCGVVCNLLRHSLHRMILGDTSAGFTLRKKQSLDFSLLSAGCCPYREWSSLVSCLIFSILAHIDLLHWFVSGIL